MNAPISDHVNVNIAIDAVSPERANFGIPMLLGYGPWPGDRVITLDSASGLSEMVNMGFSASSPYYRMAQALLSQSPKVEKFKLGKLRAHTQSVKLEVLTGTQGDSINVTISKNSVHAYERTVPASSSPEAEATAFAAWINTNVSGLTATVAAAPNDTKVQCVVDTPGEVYYYDAWKNLNVTDETPDPGIAADLNEIEIEDDDWYACAIDLSSKAIGDALAGWISTRRKMHHAQTQDSGAPTSATTDLASSLESNTRRRSAIWYTHKQSLAQYPACAFMGVELAKDPGSYTAAFKQLTGVSPSRMTADERGHLENKNANYYIKVAGVKITRHGRTGSGEWIDRVRFSDWFQARIEESIFDLMVSNDKLGYDDDTVDLVEANIYAVFKQAAENNGVILSSFSFSAPKASEQATADRNDRIMRGIKFSGVLTDGVHKFYITGQLQ